MMYNQELANRIEAYVINLFNTYQTPELVYHNLSHTQNVVAKVKEIAGNYLLNETELFILIAAAWFHDCGHLFGPPKGHEEKSVVVMREYMEKEGAEEDVIQLVGQCILSTQLPSNPETLLEKILCDADLFHLGTDDFFITDEMVRKEFQLKNKCLPLHWDEHSVSFLECHRYFTSYCKTLLTKGKQKNISTLLKRITRAC